MKNKLLSSSIFKINKNKFFTFNNISKNSFGATTKKQVDPLQELLKRPLHENHYVHNYSNTSTQSIKCYFDPVKYTRVLDQQQRIDEKQGVPFVDNANELNPQTFQHWGTTNNFECPKPNQIYTVMVPYESEVALLESNIIDETEIRARIYNLLRQFDYMDLKNYI